MSKNHKDLASEIIRLSGGKDNISRSMHCYTRLRLNLKDNGLADLNALKSLDVIGAQFSGEQLQIIIGNEVKEVYGEVCMQIGIKREDSINENPDGISKTEETALKNIFNKIIDGIVGCMVPLLPILIGAGLLKAIIMLSQQFGVPSGNATLTTFSFVADSAFYFMPVFLGGFAAKKFGANVALGMLLGGSLIHPNFIASVSSGNPGSVFGIPIYAASYVSTVIPAILSVWIMSHIEKIISKYLPKHIRTVMEPLLVLLVMIPLAFCILAPLGAMFSAVFANVLNWLYTSTGFVSVAIFAAIIPFVVMLGMHVGIVPVSIAAITATGIDKIILPGFFLANFAQGAACLAVGMKAKDAKLKSFALSSAFSNFVPGISEPGMYGVTLRYKSPMIGAMIGAAAGGVYFGITGVGAREFMPPNIFQFMAYVDGGMGLINAIIGVVITIVTAFIATMILYRYKQEERGNVS